PVWIDTRAAFAAGFPEAYARLRPDGPAQAFVALPLLHGDELVGALAFGFPSSSADGMTDRTMVRLLSQSVGSALARARSFEREQTGRKHAENMAHAREEVLGIVAHDLRNPLNVAGSTIQMLREEALAPVERERFLAAGVRAVHQM